MGILNKEVINFNNIFPALVVPQILVKCLLHASHHSVGHVGTTKVYHFLKQLYYFKSMRKKLHEYVGSYHKCQIMNLLKPSLIDLHQEITQAPQEHLPIDLLGPYNTTSSLLGNA